ncbi:PIR protein [Plasmodium vivax]|uniref:VIR protein n=1 Tax=Plasmodium vivax TaxID=5855 RepID=A0A565A575_PLAVI|nr:PIR protein [Plasmodium vivax]
MYKPNIDYCEGTDKDQIKDLLKNVTLYKLYNTYECELKNDPAVGTCNEQCDAKLRGESNEVLKLLKLCKGFCNIISRVINKNRICKESSCRGSFIYMNIWLHDHVIETSASDEEINNFYTVLESIMKTDAPELYEYNITNYNKYKSVFKHMKYLSEFLNTCDDIQKEISTNMGAKDQLYCTYIKEFFKYYNKIEGSCPSAGTKPIYCNVIGMYKPTLINARTIDSIYNKCKFDKIPCESDSPVKKDFPCLEIKDNLFKNQSQSGNIRNIASTLNTAILPFISISGISLIFYKFTPLGSYLRTRLRRKKNINTNTHEEKYNNLENISEIQGNYTDNINYNIMYK